MIFRYGLALLGLFLVGLLSFFWMVRLPAPRSPGLVFWSTRDVHAEMYRIRPDGDQLQRLRTGQRLTDQYPLEISPDGRWLLFRSARFGRSELHRLWLDGGIVQTLTPSLQRDQGGSFSPDGRWITFESEQDGAWQIYRVRVDGSVRTVITQPPLIDARAQYSPDGEWIIFQTYADAGWALARVRPDGRDRQILYDAIYGSNGVLMMTGSRLVFAAIGEASIEVMRMNLDGSGLRQLTDDSFRDVPMAVAPDESWILFASHREDGRGLYRMSWDGDEVQCPGRYPCQHLARWRVDRLPEQTQRQLGTVPPCKISPTIARRITARWCGRL
jgi:Tol biopolymer transport system component